MPGISLVMPLFNAASRLPLVLPPLLEALAAGELLEIIVVDDGSTDQGPEICRKAGLRVISSPGRLGPGARRNEGVAEAQGEIILFVDSDVVIHRDVPRQIAAVFQKNADCVALFGSYDDRPYATGWVSQYRNLLHHYVHQNGNKDATTFWAGCGAVRRETFQAVGGFDIQRYPHSSIEDIELGHRLRATGGRIFLCRDILSTHLKKWTFRNMVFTDIYRRAIPWTRLTLQPGYAVNDLNLSGAERARALIAAAFWLSLLLTVLRPVMGFATLGLFVSGWLIHRHFFALVRRRCGTVSMLVAVLLQQVHYLYSGLAYLLCRVDGTWRLSASLARFNALAFAVIFGALSGLAISAATLFLVLQGGPMTGRTLGLLSQFFPGYEVTVPGAFIGLLWGFTAGAVLTAPPAWLYYRGAVMSAEVAVPVDSGDLKPGLVSRIRIFDSALAFGGFCGFSLLLATFWLLLKQRPGEPLGANLGRLSQFLPGYSVSWVGGLIGFAYLMVLGGLTFAAIGWLYNHLITFTWRSAVRPGGRH